MASNVSSNRWTNTNDIIYANALYTKCDKSNTYLKAKLDSKVTTSNLLIHTLYNSPSVGLGWYLSFGKLCR